MTKALAGTGRVLRFAPQLIRLGLIAGVLVAAVGMPVVVTAGKAARTGSDFFLGMESDLNASPAGQTSYIYASDGSSPVTMFYEEYRKYVPLTDMSAYLQQAIVAAEDARYYDHKGVDFKGVARAFVANQTAGEVSQGASTLTMQYVRMALRDSAATPMEVIAATEQTGMRKMREIRLALDLEKTVSKEDILERYLNIAYFGHRAYGAFAAAQIFFSKLPSQLTLVEAATLAGLVKAPSAYDPASNESTAAKDRRDWVLHQMAESKYITAQEAQEAMAQPVALNVYQPPNDCVSIAPEHNSWGFFCDFFKTWWMKQPAFGDNPQERLDKLRRGGYQITTTLDAGLQDSAMQKVTAKESIGSAYAHGLVAVQPGTGRVKVMAVNRNYSLDQSGNGPHTDPNKRNVVPSNYPNTVNPLLGGGDLPGYQAGSTFKWFVLMAALDAGFGPTTAFMSPQRLVSAYPGTPGERSTCGTQWCPGNASGAMTGVQNMWTGFGKSVNTYFVQLEQAVGADRAVRMAERLGLRWRSETDQMMATPERAAGWGAFTLGVADTTPLEMANAYAVGAADGVYCEPIPVLAINHPDGTPVTYTDKDGTVHNAADPRCHQEVSAQTARTATDAARCVTGYGAAGSGCGGWSTAPGVYGQVGRPVAGKTGTTDDNRTAWFVGFTPQLAVASFMADPDYPFNNVGGGNSIKPINSAAEILREGSGPDIGYFPYP
ncbi:transglycosylase domain-containing protein [Rhizocola hellebori]|nr:transglycosylase domain-containing protein [Rhizocola hellebori]